MTEIDLREKLFSEFKDSNTRLEDMRLKIREHSQQLESMHKEASDVEMEFNFLRRTVHLVLTEDLDPVLAKFRVSEETKNNREKSNSPGIIGYAISAADDVRRPGKIKRIIRAIREICNERY